MFLIDAIKPKIEKKVLNQSFNSELVFFTRCLFLGTVQSKTSFV